MKDDPQPVWHFLCNDAGAARSCNACARNPANQPNASKAKHQAWGKPLIASDKRCSDWIQKRG